MSLQSSLLKEGTRHLSGIDEAVLKCLEAVKDMCKMIRTSLGPQGMNKMIINSHDKLFVTNDSSTILTELDVFHPAAKLVVMNATRQQQEMGDGTNFMVSLCGELLTHAESLLRMGLHISDIIAGYYNAGEKAIQILNTLEVARIKNHLDVEEVARYLRPSVMSKQYGCEGPLSKALAESCVQICPSNPAAFDVDAIRVVKIAGCGVDDTTVVRGMVICRNVEGTITRVDHAKVAVFGSGLDSGKPESKDIFLVTTPDQLEDYQLLEESQIEKVIKSIADSGANVVVCHGKISELAMHFLERYKIMIVKLVSKFDVIRLCKVVGAVPIQRLGGPTVAELGECDSVYIQEIGSTRVVVFSQNPESFCRLSTIVLRGSTDNVLDEFEHAIEHGVYTYRAMLLDPRFVAGAGASEIELATRIKSLGETVTGLDQYAFKKFSEALEIVPRTLAENAGYDPITLVSDLYAAHATNKQNSCIDISTGEIQDAKELSLFDHLAIKERAIFLATDAAISVLKIDQILMSKPVGGPKPPKMGAPDGGPDY